MDRLLRLYSTRHCLCFVLTIKSNASEMYICNANDLPIFIFNISAVHLGSRFLNM